MREFTYLAPETISDLCFLLDEYAERAKLLAGGTDLLIRLKEQFSEVDYVIDLKRIPELSELICDQVGITIGAAVTITMVCEHPFIQKKYPFLIDALNMLGSVQIRNRATVVGNLCNASPLAESAPALMVLAAQVRLVSTAGERWVALHEFFVGPGKTLLEPNEFVAAVHIPLSEGIGFYQKHSRRKEVDLASVSVAVYRIDSECRIALGAVAPTPVRAWQAEAYLHEHGWDEKNIPRAVQLVSQCVKPITDVRATKDYRDEMVTVLTHRLLAKVLN